MEGNGRQMVKNTPWEALEIGMEAEARRLCVADDLYVFAHASGNLNPMHLPKEDGDGDGEPEAIAPSLWIGALISSVLGNQLPGPGTLYRSQTLDFIGRAEAGDELVAKVRLTEKGADRLAIFDTWVELADGTRICEGQAKVTAPERALNYAPHEVPGLLVQRHVPFDDLDRVSVLLERRRDTAHGSPSVAVAALRAQ